MAYGIIAGGGRGERLGAGFPKLEIDILDKPVLLYSLEAFQNSPSIDGIILAVPVEMLQRWDAALLRQRGISKLVVTIEGGNTRQETVCKAINHPSVKEGTVVIHDGARPLVTPELIGLTCIIPKGFAGVITAVPVTDTIKQVDEGEVRNTLDRELLFSVQTPQAFNLHVLRKAHNEAAAEGFTGTDDSSLVERTGGRISVIEGEKTNIKVTYMEDLAVVESILVKRENG